MVSLKKFEILRELNDKYGICIKSVQKLNKLLEEMGIIDYYANGWYTTVKGLRYSIYNSQGMNCDLWYETIVKEIAEYIKSNQ